MQIEIPTLVTLGMILVAVVSSFVRNETNQKNIINRLNQINGKIQHTEDRMDRHIETCHSGKK